MKCNARDTCACQKHLNVQLKIDKLRELKIIDTKNLTELMARLTCNGERADNCMLRLCPQCQEKN